MNSEFKKRKINNQSGAAMLISVIFFLSISLAIISGLVTPAVNEFKISSVDLNSKKSYFLAESGMEDAYYRILKNKTIGSSETLTLNANTVTTTITSISSSQKQIDALGDVSSYQRKSSLTLSTGVGTSFNYGVQVGQGGVVLSGGSTIDGNVYANGPISGDGNEHINGSAVSASSPALSADQSNGIGTPAYNVVFGDANNTEDIAQSFQLANEIILNKVQFYIKKISTPSDATVKIVNDISGSPGSTVLASGTLSASTITTSYGWIDVSFSTNPLLDSNTTYWLVIDANNSNNKYYTIGTSGGGYANGLGKIGQFGGTWDNTTPSGLDYYFSIYLGGLLGIITGQNQNNPILIGTTSSDIAQAHTVNYTSATGTIYCQTSTGNNKSCDTTQTDPAYIAFPISDANIAEWQNDALAGGVYNGDYSVGGAGATLGPKKIVGDLSVGGGGILIVSGTLWVTGNITLNGSGTIQMATSYNTNDGLILSDGTVSVSGGGHATGSGTTGSYIMMLTTSSSASAATINGGAGAMIVYAPNGTINISGGASLKEATGYKNSLTGGSSLTYESGLANNNFSSGPSGSWVVQSWGESQ